MKYNGIELTPITEPQLFDPPKEMLVWDCGDDEPIIRPVYAITRREQYPVITGSYCFEYCAEIPKRGIKTKK